MNRTIIASGLCALACGGACQADVLFSNFGPNDSYLGNTGWSLANGGPFGAHLEDAVSFIVGGPNHYFTQAEFGIGLLFGPNILHISLHADGGGVPGAVLETVTVVDGMGPLGTDPNSYNPPVVATFSGTTELHASELYWLSVSTDTSTDSWAAWNYNIVGDLGLRAWRQNGGPWNPFTGDPRGVFRVHGTPVPGPGAIAMLAFGALAIRRRRRGD